MLLLSLVVEPERGVCYRLDPRVVWELFTLMALFDFELVLERLEVAPIEAAGPAEPIGECLARFCFGDAHCHDPNEEARLRGIIHFINPLYQ